MGNPWLIPTLVRYSGPLNFDSYDVFLSLTPYALGYITLALAALMSHSTKAHLSPLSQVSSLLPFDSKSLDLASLGLAPPPNLTRIAAVPYTPPHSDTLDSLRTQFHACTGVQWTPQKLSTISITQKRIRYLTLNTSP